MAAAIKAAWKASPNPVTPAMLVTTESPGGADGGARGADGAAAEGEPAMSLRTRGTSLAPIAGSPSWSTSAPATGGLVLWPRSAPSRAMGRTTRRRSCRPHHRAPRRPRRAPRQSLPPPHRAHRQSLRLLHRAHRQPLGPPHRPPPAPPAPTPMWRRSDVAGRTQPRAGWVCLPRPTSGPTGSSGAVLASVTPVLRPPLRCSRLRRGRPARHGRRATGPSQVVTIPMTRGASDGAGPRLVGRQGPVAQAEASAQGAQEQARAGRRRAGTKVTARPANRSRW